MTHSKMRNCFLGTAMGVVCAIPGIAQAQTLDEARIAALTEECRTLITDVDRIGVDLPGTRDRDAFVRVVILDQPARCVTAREELMLAMKEAGRAEETAQVSEKVTLNQTAVITGQAEVVIPEPQVDVDIAPPEVTVRPASPRVSIRQGETAIELRRPRPSISVEIPEIIVRVDIPAPEIFIRASRPDVAVDAGDPDVEVRQAEPRITVTQGAPELEVDLDLENSAVAETATGEEAALEGETRVDGNVSTTAYRPRVQIVQNEAEAQIEYSAAEPQVNFTEAEPEVVVNVTGRPKVELSTVGEVTVVFETEEERMARREREREVSAAALADTDAAASDRNTVTVGELLGMEVYTADGEDLGEPTAIIESGGEVFLVLSQGGFLGIGDKEVAVPLSRVGYRGDRLELMTMSAAEIERARDFDYTDREVLGDDIGIALTSP